MSGSFCDHFIGEGDTHQVRGGGLESIKVAWERRWAPWVGKGADAKQAQELVRQVRQKIDLDRFNAVVMQQPETNALDGLLKMGDGSGVDLRR